MVIDKIDKQAMLDLIIEAKRTDPETGSFAEWLAEYLVEHLPPLTTSSKWVSVEDRLPPVGKRVIVCRPYDLDTVVVEQGTRDIAGWWRVYGTRVKRITHWMPMPKPLEGMTAHE